MRFTTARTATCAAVLAAGACSAPAAPADQEPVDPAAGRYEISIAGAMPFRKTPAKQDGEYCLKESERGEFPHILVKRFYALPPSCALTRRPREGNAVGGDIACRAEESKASGHVRFAYDGAVAAERAEVSVNMSLDVTMAGNQMSETEEKYLQSSMKAVEKLKFEIVANRIGDC